MDKEITIPDQKPGAAPGMSLHTILRYAPAIEAFIAGLVAGQASFVVSVLGHKLRVTIAGEP